MAQRPTVLDFDIDCVGPATAAAIEALVSRRLVSCCAVAPEESEAIARGLLRSTRDATRQARRPPLLPLLVDGETAALAGAANSPSSSSVASSNSDGAGRSPLRPLPLQREWVSSFVRAHATRVGLEQRCGISEARLQRQLLSALRSPVSAAEWPWPELAASASAKGDDQRVPGSSPPRDGTSVLFVGTPVRSTAGGVFSRHPSVSRLSGGTGPGSPGSSLSWASSQSPTTPLPPRIVVVPPLVMQHWRGTSFVILVLVLLGAVALAASAPASCTFSHGNSDDVLARPPASSVLGRTLELIATSALSAAVWKNPVCILIQSSANRPTSVVSGATGARVSNITAFVAGLAAIGSSSPAAAPVVTAVRGYFLPGYRNGSLVFGSANESTLILLNWQTLDARSQLRALKGQLTAWSVQNPDQFVDLEVSFVGLPEIQDAAVDTEVTNWGIIAEVSLPVLFLLFVTALRIPSIVLCSPIVVGAFGVAASIVFTHALTRRSYETKGVGAGSVLTLPSVPFVALPVTVSTLSVFSVAFSVSFARRLKELSTAPHSRLWFPQARVWQAFLSSVGLGVAWGLGGVLAFGATAGFAQSSIVLRSVAWQLTFGFLAATLAAVGVLPSLAFLQPHGQTALEHHIDVASARCNTGCRALLAVLLQFWSSRVQSRSGGDGNAPLLGTAAARSPPFHYSSTRCAVCGQESSPDAERNSREDTPGGDKKQRCDRCCVAASGGTPQSSTGHDLRDPLDPLDPLVGVAFADAAFADAPAVLDASAAAASSDGEINDDEDDGAWRTGLGRCVTVWARFFPLLPFVVVALLVAGPAVSLASDFTLDANAFAMLPTRGDAWNSFRSAMRTFGQLLDPPLYIVVGTLPTNDTQRAVPIISGEFWPALRLISQAAAAAFQLPLTAVDSPACFQGRLLSWNESSAWQQQQQDGSIAPRADYRDLLSFVTGCSNQAIRSHINCSSWQNATVAVIALHVTPLLSLDNPLSASPEGSTWGSRNSKLLDTLRSLVESTLPLLVRHQQMNASKRQGGHDAGASFAVLGYTAANDEAWHAMDADLGHLWLPTSVAAAVLACACAALCATLWSGVICVVCAALSLVVGFGYFGLVWRSSLIQNATSWNAPRDAPHLHWLAAVVAAPLCCLFAFYAELLLAGAIHRNITFLQMQPEDAIVRAAARTGVNVAWGTLAACVAFGSLLFSESAVHNQLGLTVALSSIGVLVVSLLVAPGLHVLAHRAKRCRLTAAEEDTVSVFDPASPANEGIGTPNRRVSWSENALRSRTEG